MRSRHVMLFAAAAYALAAPASGSEAQSENVLSHGALDDLESNLGLLGLLGLFGHRRHDRGTDR